MATKFEEQPPAVAAKDVDMAGPLRAIEAVGHGGAIVGSAIASSVVAFLPRSDRACWQRCRALCTNQSWRRSDRWHVPIA